MSQQLSKAGLRNDVLLDTRCVEQPRQSPALCLIQPTPLSSPSDLARTDKLSDAKAMGIPFIVVVGDKHNLAQLEVYSRRDTNTAHRLSVEELVGQVRSSPFFVA